MPDTLKQYEEIVGSNVIRHLQQLAAPLRGLKIVHVNSTREGGGVAEILNKMIPLKQSLGLDAQWEVIDGNPEFFECTKSFHNGLQGTPVGLSTKHLKAYEDVNAENAEKLRPILSKADIVFIHDPQPAGLYQHFPRHEGRWIWRCHIDLSRPYRPVWKYLRPVVAPYSASIFSLSEFAQPLPHPQFLVPPSIDALSEKNIELPEDEVRDIFPRFGIDPNIPLLLQVSRFDRFKDPLGVIEAYKIVKEMTPVQLALVGGTASDDPEGAVVLEEVQHAANGDPNIHIISLPPDAHRTINAFQRASDIVLQKSLREGFGLTVTEALWKGKPVIGGDVGGIRLQIVNHRTGYLVRTPEGAALRIRFLLHHRGLMEKIGYKAKELVRENFLLTRHLGDYLSLMHSVLHLTEDRIELGVA
ncbi:MAG: glycosyltransferase [Candidatus Eisenbacteria bacterium]|uniref:Glycosyltransferase n=1 Tax=Eiseniibacteriota bacterium TaxID=2212470 RepID=A0A948W4K0_UNCEI|nr:glycosyltransferase [Candidatus Eisenbacteria bacterium]MBU1948181.1 glycosyltransferase [Candidatus Eisenbacteria bacterium]MBU2692302.1 glycosyltransferase [Candidatus Eisenbacteria bacterium]